MAEYTITYRSVKGSPLTNTELDNNFKAFDQYKVSRDGSIPFTGNVYAPTYTGTFTGAVNNNVDTNTGSMHVGWNGAANDGTSLHFASAQYNHFSFVMTGTNGSTLTLYGNDDGGGQKYAYLGFDRTSGFLALINTAKLTSTPSTTDNSTQIATTAYVQAQGYITANGTAKYVTTITSAQVTGALAYTPVQQGTGNGQGTNVVKLGWDSNSTSSLRLTVDSTDAGYFPMSSTATGNTGTFTYSGSIVASGNVTAYSDEKLKDNWNDLPMNFIEQLATVKSGTFDRIDLDNERQVGVSAQSMKTVLPESIQESVGGTLSVAYGNAALVAAIELAKRVVELEDRLAALEGK